MIIFFSFKNESEKIKFEYIYNKYKRLLLYKAHEILKDYSLAEDSTNEAFIRIYKNLDKIESLDSNKTISFLVTIVKNTSLTLLSKEKKVDFMDFDENSNKEDDFNLEESVVSKIDSKDIFETIDKLKEDLKSVFLLKYAHDLSHKEIGEMLNISENNVTVRIHRAKKKLFKIFEKEGYLNER